MPLDVTLHCLKVAKENKVLTILNPAPASELSNEFFKYIDFFTPNETEAEFYTGVKIANEEDAKVASQKLLQLGMKKIIIPLAEKGLFNADYANESQMLKILSPVTNSKSVWKSHALYLLAEYFLSLIHI